MIPIGSAITLYRKDRKLTQGQVAQRMKCPRTYVTKIENGHSKPNIEQIFRFAVVLNTQPHRIVKLALRLMDNPNLVLSAESTCTENGAMPNSDSTQS